MSPTGDSTSIRKARTGDFDAIASLIALAFEPEANRWQGEIIQSVLFKELVRDGDDVVSLVAEGSGIVGHVFVSPVSLEPDTDLSCAQVSPLSVHPDFQTRGIGSALMKAAIEKSREAGLDALFLLGNPDYYERFGFSPSGVRSAYGPSKYFQELELKTGCLESADVHVHLAPAFTRLGL